MSRVTRRNVVLEQVNLVPVDAQAGHDAHFARCADELAGQVHGHGLGFAGRHPHIFDDGLPVPVRILHLKIREYQVAMRFGGGQEGAAVGPIHPALEHQGGFPVGGRSGEIEVQGVQFRHPGMIAPERIRVAVVEGQQGRAHVVSMAVPGRRGVHAARPAVQTELRKRRRLEFFVGDDFGIGRVVERHQLDLVDVGDLPQFLRHVDLEGAIARDERARGDGNVFLVIHRKILAVAGARAQRRYAQHVGDELVSLAVPREDHGARSGQARRFVHRHHAINRRLHFVLNQTVRPGNPDGIHAGVAAQSKYQRDARVGQLPVLAAGLHFHLGVHRELGVLHPGEPISIQLP